MTESNLNNIKSQIRKGILEYCILLFLSQERAYPSDIVRHFQDADMVVVEATLYTLLNRLKREGKLTYEWQESTMGPPRKYYSITEEGINALEEMSQVWDEIYKTVCYFKDR